MSGVRTTVDLPDDLHKITLSIARDAGISMSETVAKLLRTALGAGGGLTTGVSARTGLTVMTLGQPLTSEDARSLDDDDA